MGGVVTPSLANLVTLDCETRLGKCTSEVELISLYFETDGNLTVEGSVILDYNNERYLAKMVSSMTNYDNMRTLEEENNDNSEGKFDLSVMVLHELPTQSSGNIFCLSSSLLSLLTLIMLMS